MSPIATRAIMTAVARNAKKDAKDFCDTFCGCKIEHALCDQKRKGPVILHTDGTQEPLTYATAAIVLARAEAAGKKPSKARAKKK